MKRRPLKEAKKHVERSVGRSVSIKDWHRFRVVDDDVLVVIVSSKQTVPDRDIKSWREYRLHMFVNGKPRIGDIIAP